jgi:hypothetical protein
MCNCKSYNRPDWGGDTEEIVLFHPLINSQRPNGICVDICISKQITDLWDNGIYTLGCCCGHNKDSPNVIISENSNAKLAAEILDKDISRKWKILQWKLVELDRLEISG